MAKSLSERLHPYKERIALANASWEARREGAAESNSSKLVMSVVQKDNELTIKLTHQDGDKDLEVQATEKVRDLLQAVCARLGITLGSIDVLEANNCDRTDTDNTSTRSTD